MSSPDWICLTSQPNINRRAATQQISTRLAKLTELIYSNLYDWLSVFFLSFVCVCIWQQGLRFPSSSYGNPIASRRNQIDSLRLSDRYYIPKTTTHAQKKTDWLEQKTTQIGVALLFSRVSFRINGTVSIEFTFKIRAKHFFRSSLIYPVVEINESVSRIFFSYRKKKKKRIKMNSVV